METRKLILRDAIYRRRRSLLYWNVGLFALSFYLGAFVPSVIGNKTLDMLAQQLPAYAEALFGKISGFTTPEGFIDGKLFLVTAPLLFLVFTTGFATDIIAGDERRGTLELLLSAPLPRSQVVLERFGALVLATGMMAASQALGLVAAAALFAFDLAPSRVFAVTIHLFMLAVAFGAFALFLGNLLGRRGLAAGLTALLAVLSYLTNSMAQVSDVLKPFRPFSLFYYYHGHRPLLEGVNWQDVGVMAAVALACLGASLWAVERRDLGV